MPTIDQLEIVRNLLGLGIVAANIGVWRGVYLENEYNDSWTKETGWILLVRCLALEAIFAFALLFVDFTISHRQKAEIISLEEYLTPRVLTNEQNVFIVNTWFRKHFRDNSSRQKRIAQDSQSALKQCPCLDVCQLRQL